MGTDTLINKCRVLDLSSSTDKDLHPGDWGGEQFKRLYPWLCRIKRDNTEFLLGIAEVFKWSHKFISVALQRSTLSLCV